MTESGFGSGGGSAGGGRGRPAHYQDREVVESYAASRYASGLARWKHRRKAAVLRRWIGGTSPSRVLEVACGPGRFFETYRAFPSISGDLSREMLEAFRQTYPDARLVRIEASALPFPDATFDVVFATRFLSHLRGEYRASVLRELARVSRQAVILDGRHPYNWRFLSRWVRRRLGLSHADKLRIGYPAFRAELESAGLDVIRFQSIAWGLSGRFLVLARRAFPRGSAEPQRTGVGG